MLRACADELASVFTDIFNLDYSSALNKTVPCKLNTKLRTLGLHTSLFNWMLIFLTGHAKVVRVGNNTSATLTLNTVTPQWYLLFSLLYSLFTHDSNTIIKFSDDTTVVGLITDEETAYREEVSDLAVWCQDNNLSLNVSKKKELILD